MVIQLARKKSINNFQSFDKKVSVLIPVRNEENNLSSLLQSLKNQSYSNYEIILIDDHSSDGTFDWMVKVAIENKDIIVCQLPNSLHGKKNAIEQGIKAASGEIILTTDSDCI